MPTSFFREGHFAEMPTVADGRGVGFKNHDNLPTLKILNVVKLILDDQGNHLDNQFGIIQVLQRSPIPKTSNWSGTFFAVSYSKLALVKIRNSK